MPTSKGSELAHQDTPARPPLLPSTAQPRNRQQYHRYKSPPGHGNRALAFPDTRPAGEAMDDLQEFQEADVLWPGSGYSEDGDVASSVSPVLLLPGGVSPPRTPELSAPVAVPRARKRRRLSRSCASEDYEEEDDGCCTNDAKRGAVLLPPHVIVDRRRRIGGMRTAAYSMCAGKGRTLKGRDLRDVRDRVLRMTGFIEE